MSVDFTHLHLHTEFSLLDGFARIDRLFDEVKKHDMDAVAITDHGVMFGVVDFFKAAKKSGVKPIIGCEVYTSARSRFDKESLLDKKIGHLILLAKNEVGYKNLIKLVSLGYTEGFYYKPRVDYEIIEKYSEGLICLSACLAGDIPRHIMKDEYELAKERALWLNNVYGQGNFYLEIQDHGIREEKIVLSEIVRLSKETDIPLIATNDVHYIKKEDSAAHEILLCIQTGKTMADDHRMEFTGDEFYLKSPEEMSNIFGSYQGAIENSRVIVDKCNFEFDFTKTHLPEYIIDKPISNRAYLKELCIEGLESKYEIDDENRKLHYDRLEYELSVINTMGFDDYFLITWDFIKYAKDNGIFVGPGRGSAGGSIVAYALDITEVDPIKYDLIFERFLNPERVTMPDIDIDFEDDRRQEVIDYVIEKYGNDRVAQIITFGTMAARGAIRDVGRVLSIPYQDVDKMAKAIPMEIGMTIEKALKKNIKLKEMYNQDEVAKKVLDVAMNVQGSPRNASTHAAGVVISKLPINNYVPLYAQDKNISTQFNMVLLEELGLLKMDFLGLKTLTVIKNALELIKETNKKSVNLLKLVYDDSLTYDMISKGNTLGVFQLESAGFRKFMRELKPSNLEEIIAGISLYRPGPMESIPKYIKNKNNPNGIEYETEMLRGILDVTYGCLVYQEQVMRIVRELGGYSYGRSDLVRRAMSKKKMKVMEEERQYFIYGKNDEDGNIEIEGCLRKGVSEDAANKIFDDMIDFAKYAFNKSHAAGYGIIAFQTAYLKAHYPVEYMAALLTNVVGNHTKLAMYIYNCKDMEIEILPPNVNNSRAGFTVEDGKIRYGLSAVKNVGSGIINSITNIRKNVKFTDFNDFCESINSKELNKKAIESLIKAGAFDDFDLNRSEMLAIFEKIIDSIQSNRRRNAEGQISLFSKEFGGISADNLGRDMPKIKELNSDMLLAFEKEMLGIYLSGHPLDKYKAKLESILSYNIGELLESYREGEKPIVRDNGVTIVAGLVVEKIEKITKNNKNMAFIKVEDLYGQIEIVIFPNTFEKVANIIEKDSVVKIMGNLNAKEGEDPKIIAQRIKSLTIDEEVELSSSKRKEKNLINANNQLTVVDTQLTVKKVYVGMEEYNKYFMDKIHEIVKDNLGDCRFIIRIKDINQSLESEFKVEPSEKLQTLLEALLGEENVKYIR